MAKSHAKKASSASFAAGAETTAKEERKIQRGIDRSDKKQKSKPEGGAMQAGARLYPVPPLLMHRSDKDVYV